MDASTRTIGPTPNEAVAALRPADSLAEIRNDARRERLLDMQVRLRPYRTACFAILVLALVSVSAEVGWWWVAPLAVGFAGLAIADRFMQRSSRPELWAAASWGMLSLLLADAVVITGGGDSPVLMWFALPAGTLGARFSPRGMALGTVYILGLLLLSTYGLDPTTAAANHQSVIAAAALIVSAVVLSGALVESDRAHRRRSTLDPLTGLFNRNALEQRLAELDGQPSSQEEGLSHALLFCDLDHFKRVNDQLGHAAGDAVLQDVAYTMRATLRAGDSIYRVGERRPVGVVVTVSIGVAVSQSEWVNTDDLVNRADAALYSAKANGRDNVFVSN